uniref:Plasmolipin n=1 Tax=Accipiter nisus TaxID=211598 RepID=A0A8B9S1Y7_9AVES
MAGLSGAARTRSGSPGSSAALPALDGAFLRSPLGGLMGAQALMIFNAVATVLYITAFVTCAAAVQPTSWRQWDYNRRAAASVSMVGRQGPRGWRGCCAHAQGVLLFQFFAGLTMIAYGVSTFFSFRAWKGFGSNAATSQVTDHT